MPITQSAKKAIRNSLRKKSFNDRRSRIMKDLTKKIDKLVKNNKNEALKLLPSVFQAIDKSAKRGVIKKNTAARKKSRLSKLFK